MKGIISQKGVEFILNDEEEGEGSSFSIPDKFRHVDLNALAKTSSGIEELQTVLKTIHPHSSLHYGLTSIDSILRLYTTSIPKKLGRICEIQILTPQLRGTLGAINLNKKIQEVVNPEDPSIFQIKMGDRYLRVNDRVIQTRNNYDLNVFNGDIGKIVGIDLQTYQTVVELSDQKRQIIYEKEDLSELNLAYAISIHKSQGSEFEAVIIPVATQHYKMLFRNLIYTGLTRGKKLVVFVGQRKALTIAVRNLDHCRRQTALEDLLTLVMTT